MFGLAPFPCLKCKIYKLQPALNLPLSNPLCSSLPLLARSSPSGMNLLSLSLVLVLLGGTWAQINVLRPACDSAEAEEAALAALDYLNGQHAHGYKYTLNRIEDIKVMATVRQRGLSSLD